MLKHLTKLTKHRKWYKNRKLLHIKSNTLSKKSESISTKFILIIDASNIAAKHKISWLALFMQVMGERRIYGGAIAGNTITLPTHLRSLFTHRNMTFYSEETKYDNRTNCEKYVDDFLHKEARTFIPKEGSITGKTMIFVTGDGNNNHGKDTFPRVIHDAVKHGFLVEIWSWSNNRSKNLTKLGKIYKDKVKINNLTSMVIRK